MTDVSIEWIGSPGLVALDELPLVLLDRPCAFHTALLKSLEQHQMPYHIVLETPALAGLTAALRAGIGLTCRTASYASVAALSAV